MIKNIQNITSTGNQSKNYLWDILHAFFLKSLRYGVCYTYSTSHFGHVAGSCHTGHHRYSYLYKTLVVAYGKENKPFWG